MEGPETGFLVYFILAGGWVKVGYTEDVRERMKQLQTGNPFDLDLLLTLDFASESSARKAERKYRDWLGQDSVVSREWVSVERFVRCTPLRFRTAAEIVADFPSRKDLIDSALISRGYRRVTRLRLASTDLSYWKPVSKPIPVTGFLF